jgi:hypothetical protein
MLEIGDDYDYDVLVALDCDTVVVRDFSSEINPQYFQAMPVDMDLLTAEQWQKLFSYFDLNIEPEKFSNTTNARKTIIPYFSSAVMSIPKQYITQIRNRWNEYFFGLFEYSKNLKDLALHKYYFEELALSLAVEKEKIPSMDFPMEMNFPTNYSVKPSLLPGKMSPFIIHYHHLYNLDGTLSKSGYKKPDLAIEQVNKIIRHEANNNHYHYDTSTKKIYSEAEQKYIVTIANDVRVLQKISLAKQKLIEERQRKIKAVEDQLQKAIKDVELLHSINLGHQKTLGEKDAELKRAIKDVEILQNINLGNQKTIVEKDKLIEQLDSQLKQAINDVGALRGANLEYQKRIEQRDAQIQSISIELQNLKTVFDSIHHNNI